MMTSTVEASAEKKSGLAGGIESALKLRLLDRPLWLMAGLGLYLNLTLSLLAARFPSPVSDFTFQLLARLMLVTESTLVATAALLALGTASRWLANARGQLPSRISLGLSGVVTLALVALVQVLPLLFLHQYPDLAEQSIRVLVTLLQRAVLLALAVTVFYNLLLALLLQLRLPAVLAVPSMLALYGWATFAISKLSHDSPRWHNLNDIYYWNQLWRHLPNLPRLDHLQLDRAIHNVGQPLLGMTLTFLAFAVVISTALWLPGAAKLDRHDGAT